MCEFDRRALLKSLPFVAGAAALGGVMKGGSPGSRKLPSDAELLANAEKKDFLLPSEPLRDEGALLGPIDAARAVAKARDFDRQYPDDRIVGEDRMPVLLATAERFEKAQRLIGHGNFNVIGFDSLLRFSRTYSEIGAFEKAELELLEELFHTDASHYGFLGDKLLTGITDGVRARDLERIPGTGHYLLKGAPLEMYQEIRQAVGDTVLLTSGVRGIAKQYQLFLKKAVVTEGNLSQAARSLAPPGYSYHAVGDFDIGKKGLGADNFTDRFAETDEFKKLIDLGYVDIRYPEENPFGVRHEPWHIKITA